MKYEILDGETVINTIVADAEFMQANFPAGNYRLVPEPEPTLTPELRRIFVGSFFDRFGPYKWAILADPAPMVQALVKDCQVRRYIDLDNPDLLAGLAMLVSAGHAIDPDAVINAPITEDERWTG